MIQLSRESGGWLRVRVEDHFCVHPDCIDPWRLMFLVTRGVLLGRVNSYETAAGPVQRKPNVGYATILGRQRSRWKRDKERRRQA